MRDNELTPRERFLRTLTRLETDRVSIFDTPNNPELFIEELGAENKWSEGVPDVLLSKKLGLDACLVPEGGYTALLSRQWEWVSNNSFIDELGVEYRYNDSSWPLAIPVKTCLKNKAEWSSLSLPDPTEEWRHKEIRAAVAEAHKNQNDDIAVIAGIRSAFAVLYISMGLENMSYAIYDAPDLLREMAERIDDFWTRSAIMAAEAGADAVFIANDMGLNGSTIIAPDNIRKIFFSSLFKMLKEIKRTGLKIIFHSCGNIMEILGELADSGIDCYNNLQVTAGMNISEIKKLYGQKIALMGNVDATNIMPYSDVSEIEGAVKQVISVASPRGGHILATDHSFHKGIPIENVYAFIKAGRKWGTYPLQI